MLLLLSLVFAQTDAPVLVDQAIGRIETGDYDGALILLDTSESAPGADPDRITYLRGVATELDGDPATAITLYEAGHERWPDSPLTDDRVFRTAEAEATLDVNVHVAALRVADDESLRRGATLVAALVAGLVAVVFAAATVL